MVCNLQEKGEHEGCAECSLLKSSKRRQNNQHSNYVMFIYDKNLHVEKSKTPYDYSPDCTTNSTV